MDILTQYAYILSAGLFIYGLKQLSSPATARRGNAISSLGMLIAITTISMAPIGSTMGAPAALEVWGLDRQRYRAPASAFDLGSPARSPACVHT